MGLINMTSLVRDTADELEMPQSEVRDVINTFFDTVALELEDGNDVRIGTFIKLTQRYQFPVKKGTPGRNPATGEAMLSPGRPAKIRIGARALKSFQESAPSPTSKAGKPIADLAKRKRADREARAREAA